MQDIVIPGLYLLCGICAFATIQHLLAAFFPSRDRTHLLFACMTLAMGLYVLCQAWSYQAETVVQLAAALKVSMAVILPGFILFLWFFADFTGLRPLWLLRGITLVFVVLIAVDLAQPFSLQFSDLQGLQTLQLPWGETLILPIGRTSAWFFVAAGTAMATFLFALYALWTLYRRSGGWSVLMMMLAAGVTTAASTEEILVRMCYVDFVYLGPFGFLTLVIGMSLILSYQTNERLRVSENRFRALVEQAPLSIQVMAPSGRLILVNSAWEQMWGIKLKMLPSYNILLDRQLIEKGIIPYMERGFAGEACEIPPIVYNPAENPGDGMTPRDPHRSHWTRGKIFPIKDEQGEITEVVLMHEDITEKKWFEDAIREIAGGVASKGGQLFFQRFIQQLGKLFGADYALIGLLAGGDVEVIETLAVCAHGEIVENFTYALAGTPCANLAEKETCVYPRDVRQLFPKDALLVKMNAEGYFGAPLFDSSKRPLGIIAIVDSKPLQRIPQMADIIEIFAARAASEIERMRAERELSASEARFRTLVEDAPGAVYLHDLNGRILHANRMACQLLDYSPTELQSMTVMEIDADEPDPAALQTLWNTMNPASCVTLEQAHRRKDGSSFPVEIQLSQIAEGAEKRILAFVRDISERKRAEIQLLHQATHDQLTGLANRTLLQDRLEQTIHFANRSQRLVAVLLLDLDRFKVINDNLGHRAGDELLCMVARRLEDTVREADTVVRMGGDEFVILLSEVDQEKYVSGVAQKILEHLTQSFSLGQRIISITGSIGISLYPRDGGNGERLLRNADIAMYRSKEDNDTFHFYHPDMERKGRQMLELTADLRLAVERDEFRLHYQPKVDFTTGRIVGAEALLRWQHPQRGLIPPGSFISVAEETGLILPIGEWVLTTACAQIRSWLVRGVKLVPISVNISARQFVKPDLVQMVERILKQHRVDPHQIELELTESMIMRNLEAAEKTMRQLKELGVGLALDDFGTGYSSLNYLRRFPVNCLKIDRSFVKDVASDPSAAAVTTSIVAIAHSLRLHSVAEGVETREQFEFLRDCGCQTLQGYYACKPVPVEEFTELLAKGHPLFS